MIIRIALMLTLVLGVWSVLFYVAMIDEVDDEVDDSLEDYSEYIIIRALAGEELPSKNNGSNNQYYLHEVDEEYARRHPAIVYEDSMIYLAEKGETEPARILTTLFQNDEGQHFELRVLVPTIEKEDLRSAILGWIVFLYGVLLLTILLISAWLLHRSFRPLYRLLRWLDGYRMGKTNAPLENDTNITEFRQLNEAALRNAERGERLFEQQKQFIGNASHEMQTPLAICQNRLEMLVEEENLSEHQMEEVAKTLRTLEHISKLNKSLLLLSKIDNGQFSDRIPLSLNVVLQRYVEDYREVYAYRNIALEVDDRGEFRVEMNETLATILVTNLLKNAFVHNCDKGHIRVEITPSSMTFRNSGGGAPLAAEHIFERFYQGAKKEGSTGLGLAIVHSICKLEGLNIRYRFERGEHCFEVSTR